MANEKKLNALDLAKAELECANENFKKAYEAFNRIAHGGGKVEFRAARAEYDQAFKLREAALDRYESLGVNWTEGV